MINSFYINHVEDIKTTYQLSYPFSHIVLDNFVNESLLSQVLDECKKNKVWHNDDDSLHQINKYYLPDVNESMNEYANTMPVTKFLLDYFNSEETLLWLSSLTGIKNLIPDWSLFGGGIHKMASGGKLSVHTDFNKHRVTNLYRRINLLLYLNPVWEKNWNGCLELWDKDLKTKCIEIQPLFNRVVIFNTNDISFHGHPAPLNTPENVCRYSIAMYYYTKESEKNIDLEWQSVQWKETTNEI